MDRCVRPGAGDGVPAELFKRTLASHAAGVVVVTALPETGGPVGVTATSFTSVSLSPPLVSFYVNAASGSWPGLREARSFTVNVLAGHQEDVAARFATKGIDRFAEPTRWSPGEDGTPLIEEAAAHVVCTRHDLLAVGDHWLVVGRVTGALVDGESGPLLYHRGRYGRFADAPAAPPLD
nr:flavin reductase family protein [Nocardiopsis ansamitocini]